MVFICYNLNEVNEVEQLRLTETEIVERVAKFLYRKENGNWHEDKTKQADLHENGADLILTGGSKNGERFIIECKGKSYAKSSKSVNKEGWLNALGQIVTRMSTSRIVKSGASKGQISRSYKYGLGLYWIGAQVALRRIPKTVAQVLNLHIFSCDDNGNIKKWTPSQFGKEYADEEFIV